MNNRWKEYQERKEAQRYFRENNDLFLNHDQWFKTIGAGLLSAIVLGFLHGIITLKLGIDFSVLYLLIGYLMAQVVTSISGVSSQQVALTSAVLTLFAFYVSNMALFIMAFGFSFMTFIFAAQAMISGGILDLIFIVMGILVAYQQAA